jgi:ribosomal protein S12 methylthiotransferase accessory factor
MTGLPDDLGDAGRAYVDAMPKGEIVAFPITPIDRIGLPVWIVALFPDDDRLADVMPYGVGYGVSDAQAALGALGECMEMVFPALTLPGMKRIGASWTELVAVHGADAVADPFSLGLPAGSPVDRQTRVEWVESRRARDGATVLVPIDVVALTRKDLSAGYAPFTTLITNGMGAGPDRDWATGHGLLELLQRDGNGLVFKALDRGIALELPEPPPSTVAPILARFEAAGIRVIPKFAADDFGLANLYCVGFERDGRDPPLPIMVTGCGEACHPDRDRALEKCLCEFAASRARKAFAHGPSAVIEQVAPRGYVDRFLRQAGSGVGGQEGRAFAAMRDWSSRRPADIRAWLANSVHAVRGSKPFDDLPSTPATGSREAGRIARARVEAAGIDVLSVDLTPPGAPVSVAKTIAPGLEVETMSYGRIGERNTRRLIERNDPLVVFGTPSETRKPIRLSPEALARFGRQPLLDMERLAAVVGPLYPLYREPEAHHVAAAEVAA